MQSLQLFSWHAFGKGKPNAKFAKMSKEVAVISAGVPLALEIFGSRFFDLNEIKEWKDMLEKLKKYQDKHIHEKLKISYDVLDEEEKKVFLDMACFFIGHERKLATLMWEDCKFFPNITIKVLVHKSLVSIDDQTEEFKMHDHIRDMGRKIVQDESLYTPGMCSSRLQMDDDTLDILQNKRGRENVEAIQLSWSPFVYSMSIEAESFATMPQLRMLQLGKMGTSVTLKGQYDGFPKALRWLQWNIPRGLESLPDDLHLENIVVLDLSWSSITQVWSLQTSARCKAFEKLKVLRLAYCRNLTSCPDFGSIRMPHLQELNFEGCENMSKIHPCIGLLKSLTHLNLSCCTSLKKLPEEIYELTSLEELDLGYCYGLTTLPSWLGDSKSLKRHLLGKLKVLKLQGCTNLTIWSDFRSMPCLQQLYFDGCEIITELSPSIEQLKSLIYLDLRSCNSLKELPQEVGQLTSLKELNLGYCSQISSLPVSMGHLKQLKWLSLEKCSSLKEVPECIMSLDQLEILILDRCEKLKILAHFPPSLTKLYAGDCHQLEIIADVSNLKGLQELDLNNCERLVDIPGIEQLNCLRSLCLGGCKSFHHSFFERVQELDKLEILELYNCENLTKHRDFASSLNWLSNLKKYLRKLDLSWTDIEELPGLDRLEILRVAHCNRLKFLPKLPPSLTGLDAKWCTELRRIEDVSSAKGLWGLYLSGCTKLVDVPGIEQLEGLQDLGLGGCRNLRYSFFERLQEANFQHLERFCVPGRLIDGGPSYHKSVSFLLPKQFNSGLLYLYVEERRLHSIRSKLVERNGATRLPDKSIPTDEVIDDKLSRSVVRVDITTADAQFPFTTFIVKWDVSRKVLKATFGWDSELMRMASEGRFEGNNVDDNDAQWSRTMMMMRVSMDSCVLCSGDLLIHKATDKACFNWLDRDPCEGYNIVMVEFQRRPY